MVKMKALRSFGVAGANEGKVRRGREFTAGNEHRAKDLEDHGLAYRLEETMLTQPVSVTEIMPPLNKAAHAGPLLLAGGETGEAAPAPSSPPDHPLRRRRSSRFKDEDYLS